LNSNYGIEFIILLNIFELTKISEGLKPIWKFELNQRKNVRCNCALWDGFSLGRLDQGWRPMVKTEEARSSSTTHLPSGGPAVANVPVARVGRGDATT
jgi:hypothetical protein